MRLLKKSLLPQGRRRRRESPRSFARGIEAVALLISSPLMGEDEGGGDTGSEFSPSLPLFPLRPPPIQIFLWMGCRRAADLAKGPPSAGILISILKSGSGIPYSLIYGKGCGTSSPPTRGGEKLFFTHIKILRETKELFQS
jgi:hypothetical protein